MSGVLLLDSMAVAAGATALALGTGLLAALALAGASGGFRTLLMAGTIVNLALPPFLAANHWLDLTASWRATAAPGSLADGSWFLTALTLGGLLWPVASLLVLGAWSRLQTDLLESDPAVRGFSLVRHFLLPVARPELLLAAVVLVTLSLANFTVPVLFQVRVFTEEFWIRFNTRLDAAGALRSTWPLLLPPVFVLAVFRGRRWAWPRWQNPARSTAIRSRLGAVWPVACGVTLVWIGFTVVFPLGRLGMTSRTWLELPGAFSAGLGALLNSLGTASVTATLVVLAGVAVAAFGQRLPFRGLAWIPFLIPGVMTGVVLIAVFNRPGFSAVYQSLAVVVIALVLRYLAVGGSLVDGAVAAADPGMSDAARTVGATPWRVFRDTVWPQIAPACAAAWYTVYLLCLWDVESVVLIQPPGGETLALKIFNLLHYGHAAQVNALCVLLLAVAVAPWLVWTTVTRWTSRGGVTVLALLTVAGVAGCGRAPESGPELTPLKSKLFSGVTVLGSRGVSPGQFNKPRSLVCDRDDNLYVMDLTGRVQKFSPDGRYLLQWQMPETDLGKPKGMTLDRDGNVVVVEPHYMRVNHFTPGGQLVAQWGVKGTNVGEFILPRGIAQDSRGDFHLSEYTVVDRVQRFTLGPDTSARSLGRCVEVLPAGTNHIQACPTAVWGSPGTENGQFNRAENVAVGPRDEVFVADSCNHRIQVFDRDGKFLRCHGRAGSHPGEFSYPYDIRVDASGNQYICEFGNSRITILDARDQVIEVVGGAGAAPGRFANPWSIALDSKGNLYIADSQNHRVQKLIRR